MLAMRQKLLDHAKQSARDAFKTASEREIQKTPEANGDLIGNKIANKITGLSKNPQKIIQKQLQISMINKYLKKDIISRRKTENY